MGVTSEGLLPNITGSIAQGCYSTYATDAFYYNSALNSYTDYGGQYSHNARAYTFNASRSSSIYGDYSYVRPRSIIVKGIIKY